MSVCDVCGGCASDPCSMAVHEEAAREAALDEAIATVERLADVYGEKTCAAIADAIRELHTAAGKDKP